MQMIKDEIRYTKEELAGGTGLGMVVLIGAVALLCFSGCASLEVYAGVRRSDTSTETRSASDKPVKCFFTNCKEG